MITTTTTARCQLRRTGNAMLLTHILWTWIFLTVPATADLDAPPPPTTQPQHPTSMMLNRLERLETLLADHQAQYRHDRDTWGKESRMLRKNLRRLQGDVLALQREKREMRKEIGALQNAQALSLTLAAENQALKSQMDHLQRLLISSGSYEQNSVSDGPQSPRQQSGQSGQAVNTSQPEGTGHQDHDPSPGIQRTSHPIPFWRWNRSGLSRQHVQSARSDDQGPLQVVVDHLAATTNQLSSDLQAMQTKHSSDVQTLRSQVNTLQAAQGSTFVQWGSSTCSGASELVYSGVVGGSFYNDPGAAANTLCLSMTPTLLNKATPEYTVLHGGEYETGDSHHNMTPLCAVCRAHQPTTIMVPGTNVCAAGWNLMYSGYLMAGHNTHHATEFICVDTKLEGEAGSYNNNDGKLLYFTRTRCDHSLPCLPYVNDKVVTCAVCSK